MAAASNISDAELRRQLNDLGQEIGPITQTTRQLYLRKLAKLQKSRETRSSPKTAVPTKGKGKSPSVKKTPAVKESSSPSRKLVGFSSDEEENEPRRSRFRRSFVSVREREAREERSRENISSRPPDTNIKPRRSFVNPPQEDESIVESDDQQDSEVSEPDGYVYRGTPLRLRAFQSRNRISPATRQDRHPDEEFVEPKPRRHGGAGERKSLLSSLPWKLILLVALICIGALIYFAMRSPAFAKNISPRPGSLPICEDTGLAKNQGSECIKLDDLCIHYALQYLYSTLSHQAGLFECGYSTHRNMSKATFRRKIREDNVNRQEVDGEKILIHTLQLVINNSHLWHIRLFDQESKEVNKSNTSTVEWIDTSVAIKPLLCRITDASNLLVLRLFMILLGGVTLLIVYFFVRHHWRREEEETRRMYYFVEKIIDVLREHQEASKNDKVLLPYLPIPHVRDMLIPPSDRQKFSKPWNRAVRFLSANESRIRVESQRIAGEDFEVWRWIHTVTPRNPKLSLPGTKQGKFWQGQAFENFQSAVNPPIISPSPCLKIRNMFEPVMELDETWHIMIQDAIVEKCSESGANIVHIAVDKSSSEGCVYVKCDFHKSAGIAFRCLHGCWFDGRLVAVKYLTLKRYHQRFPAAREATRPLKLSGKSPSSLVTFDPNDGVGDFNDSDLDV